ncbi:hypothetical protein Q8G35_10225 [Peribacillus simplex]|uniref:Uncharacterized protein n=2 Tax=Peribacillus TaxID=2675229 RepID=A0AA90P253_9BACI|nr:MULTISPECIES: hypothetical protein [Peribacillus]MDP1418787.1 hypothetical protein [Peribacillus simplex]MDP1450841.1 hypothetical protein [Peribacillus frigoritolerans]
MVNPSQGNNHPKTAYDETAFQGRPCMGGWVALIIAIMDIRVQRALDFLSEYIILLIF